MKDLNKRPKTPPMLSFHTGNPGYSSSPVPGTPPTGAAGAPSDWEGR